MQNYQKQCTIDIDPRPSSIALSADGSAIVAKRIDDYFCYYKKIDNIWHLKTKQYIKSYVWKMQLNSQGNVLGIISRRKGKFWFDVLIYKGTKFILHNSFIIKNDPDEYAGIFYFKISDSLRFCSSEFQWRKNYYRIHSFSPAVGVRRLRKQLVRGSFVEFNDSQNVFAVQLGQQIIVYQCITFNQMYLYQSETNIYSFTFQNNEQILLHNEGGLFELNYVQNNSKQINIFEYKIHQSDRLLAFEDQICLIKKNSVILLKRVKQRVDLIKEINGSYFIASSNMYMIENKKNKFDIFAG